MEDLFEQIVSEKPESFQKWIRDQDLSEEEKAVFCFHYWMRNHTTLTPGTIVDYKKDVSRYRKTPGREDIDWSDLTVQEKSALNKFSAFESSEFVENGVPN